MKTSNLALALVLLGAAGAGGYWLGQRAQNPAADGAAVSAAGASVASAPRPRKLLYYRNPMGLADTSPTPKKDQMGMDYIAVYEAEDESASAAAGPNGGQIAGGPAQLHISTEKVQKLGVRLEAASLRLIGKTVRAAGRIEPDERRVSVIAPKFEGYVEKLLVNTTGQMVSKGQTLFEAYSPELVSAQREYLVAVQAQRSIKDAGADAQAGMQQLADSSLAHLRHWDLPAEQLQALVASGQPQRSVAFPSPVSGVVTEKKAVLGMRFMPGETLYQITDLSSVWVIADLSEQDIGLVKTGAAAKVTLTAYPTEVFNGRVTYVYPTLKAETRSVPVRVELANPGQRLKPAMFAQLELAVGGSLPVLSVPDSAVIDTGTRRIVLVQVKPGRFEPREIELGRRGENFIEVIKGVREGEQVVVAANFLIDAESNLKAVVGALGAPGAASGVAAPAAKPEPAVAATPGPAPVGHQATGTVDSVDSQAGTISLNHGPVASLNWPAMTMPFKAANASLLKGLRPGQALSFEFVERSPGDYVVTSLTPMPATSAAAAAKAPPPASAAASSTHSGH